MPITTARWKQKYGALTDIPCPESIQLYNMLINEGGILVIRHMLNILQPDGEQMYFGFWWIFVYQIDLFW